ncbi:hypothetical protein [Microbacterium sp.]|uniref:hypothetical protein n=1 Tax=Microbacterium sp. TaxID=51671 RepID=UPI0039E61E3E
MNESTIRPRILDREQAAEPSRAARAEEAEVSALAHHRDPSLAGRGKGANAEGAKKKARGVEWVRPTELVAYRSARVAGRGIDFQAELARRSRRLPGQTVRVSRRGISNASARLSERARRLPPASAFGRGSGERFSWVTRSGIGLG